MVGWSKRTQGRQTAELFQLPRMKFEVSVNVGLERGLTIPPYGLDVAEPIH
ncbi:MAG: hypothetical protein AAFY56_23870 [Pseudomonadota bacterium]